LTREGFGAGRGFGRGSVRVGAVCSTILGGVMESTFGGVIGSSAGGGDGGTVVTSSSATGGGAALSSASTGVAGGSTDATIINAVSGKLAGGEKARSQSQAMESAINAPRWTAMAVKNAGPSDERITAGPFDPA
jgi:hypothetical protein